MIYFIRAVESGAIKIGFATNVATRLNAIRVSSSEPIQLIGTVPGTRADEAALHADFATHRIRGEWFRPATDLERRIRELTASSLASDAPVPRTVDSFTVAASGWLRQLEDGTARRLGIGLREARKTVAADLGMSAGSLEVISRKRCRITAQDYDKIRVATMAELERQLEIAKALLADQRTKLNA